jgi:hypothetical protein
VEKDESTMFTRKAVILCLLPPCALLLIGFVSLTVTSVIWDGGFSEAEYRITFVDDNGQPIEGIKLKVQDKLGTVYYYYPVSDFSPSRTPTSDQSGVLVFHHVDTGVEFGGRCAQLFWFFPIGQCNTPQFVCRFLLNDKDVYHCLYHELEHSAKATNEIASRTWKWTDYFRQPLEMSLREFEEKLMSDCDHNRDGKINAEEGSQYHALIVPLDCLEHLDRGPKCNTEEFHFPVLESTIVIK